MSFNPAEAALGNPYYGPYFLTADLRALGVDIVFGIRDIDFRRGQRLAHGDDPVA